MAKKTNVTTNEVTATRTQQVIEAIDQMSKTFKPLGRCTSGKNKNAYSLRELRKLFLAKQLVPADIQRWYRTKHGNAICMSVLYGRGTQQVLINLKDGIYYIFDGAQRLISLMLYLTGYTKEDLETAGLLVDSGVKLNRSMVLSMANKKHYSFLKEENIALFKKVFNSKAFAELDKELQNYLLDNIYVDMSILCGLSDEDMLSIYCDYNSGNTKLQKFEIAKARMSCYLWGKIREIAKKYVGNFKESAMAQEKLISELFCMYLNATTKPFKEDIVENSTMLADAVEKLVAADLSDVKIDKYIKGFEKIMTEFVDSGYFALCNSRSENNAFDLRNVFYFYMKNHISCTNDSEAIIAKIDAFLNNEEALQNIHATESEGSTYFVMSKNGTNHVSVLKNTSVIFDQITSDLNIEKIVIESAAKEKVNA